VVVGSGEGTDRGAGRRGGAVLAVRQEVLRSRYAIHRAVRRLLRPPAPEPTRSALRLSLAEREEISRGLARGESLGGVARRLGRAPSTVSREVARNGGRGGYRACQADRVALCLMRRPKVAKLARCARLRAVVEAKLELRWSPQQIAGWLSVEFPTTRRCGCRTRRFTCRCSCSRGVRCARNSPATCGCVTALDVPAASRRATARATFQPW
jgi:Helix-turn-helix domain